MTLNTQRIITGYARVLLYGGLGFAGVAFVTDQRWIAHPTATAALLVGVVAMRVTPIRLSKFSYLTQTGVPALVGAVAVGPSSVVLALVLGVLAGDVLWLRKTLRAGLINAGREVLAFAAAFGVYAAVLRTGDAALTLDTLPAVFTLAALYFVTSRALFYFTLLIRGKLATVEQLLILRWEVVSYLLTIGTTVVVVGALRSLAPAGWVAVLSVLGVLGLLTKRILEEAIAAEDLHKVHVMESGVASNTSLRASLEHIERVGYRLLDWDDFRIYRWADGGEPVLLYRGTLGEQVDVDPVTDGPVLRREALASGRPVMVKHAARDPRTAQTPSGHQSMLVHPVGLGDAVLGTVEIAHRKRHAYGGKDVTALATIAAQVATAIHIAELRRPLVRTVGQIDQQVQALVRATESLRNSAQALTAVSGSMRQGVAEQEEFVRGGLEAIASLTQASNDMAVQGGKAASASQDAAEVAARNRAVIGDAIERLVRLKGFVADSTEEVTALRAAARRITGFIGSIREIADLTSLIALNAAIEAARAGQDGRGFAVVAGEVRDLSAQSMAAAREAGAVLGEIAGRIDAVSGRMDRGREVVAGVEELSADAARALDAIVGATGEAGASARSIADTADAQEAALKGLTEQVAQLADASARTRTEAETLAGQATDAARGQEELERAIQELGEVATHLQAIARHFAADVAP